MTQHFQPPLQCPEVGSIGSGRQQRRNAHQALLLWLAEERRDANAISCLTRADKDYIDRRISQHELTSQQDNA